MGEMSGLLGHQMYHGLLGQMVQQMVQQQPWPLQTRMRVENGIGLFPQMIVVATLLSSLLKQSEIKERT